MKYFSGRPVGKFTMLWHWLCNINISTLTFKVILDPDIAELALASAKPMVVEGLHKKKTLSKDDLLSLIKKGNNVVQVSRLHPVLDAADKYLTIMSSSKTI